MSTRTHTSELYTEDEYTIEQIKRETLERRIRSARSLAERVQVMPDGSRVFVRFSQGQRLEHIILMASFGTLALTGLLQTFSSLAPVALVIQVLGGVDALRTVHRLAAFVSALQSVYHVWRILEQWFVKRERGGMWPYFSDFRNLVQMLMYNMGLRKTMPEFDRFTIEEKIEYWALLWGNTVMGITGFIMWFPLVVTRVLPGQVFPVAQTLHRWEAILAALAILIWHMYHGCIKDKNRSIFSGRMSEEEMQHMHPLEYRRILAAGEFLKRMENIGVPSQSKLYRERKLSAE